MTYPNLISAELTQKEVHDILKSIRQIENKLSDLVELSEEEKSTLPKMRRNTIQFVKECINRAEQKPACVPQKIDLEEIKKDIELVRAIGQITDPLKRLLKKLEDSAMLAESEAYLPSIAIYNALAAENAARTGTMKDISAVY